MNKKPLVFVGLSGGVDSSVAALRLLHAGYDVAGVFIKVWHPDWLVCNWEAERLDAMRVAAHLGIPFLTCNAEAAYRDGVAHYFIEEYKAGRTPNPDVLCNKEVKFGAFLEFARSHGADYVATGHYAELGTAPEGISLLRGVDSGKDQSYFLWMLGQEALAQTLLPVGKSEKSEIRAEAAAAGIPTAQKQDSQGVCFLGHIDIKEFLSHYTELIPGDVLDESGEVVGKHEGALIYTIGQRHGFTLTTHDAERRPYYVTTKNISENTITVSPTKPAVATGGSISICKTNWILGVPAVGETLSFQTRYRQTPTEARITAIEGDCAVLEPLGVVEAVAAGQSCVCYRDRVCLGGGIIL